LSFSTILVAVAGVVGRLRRWGGGRYFER